MLLAGSLRAAHRELNELRAALEPFAHFARQWERNPLCGIADELYAIHAGERGAALRLSDCQRAAAILAARSTAPEGTKE